VVVGLVPDKAFVFVQSKFKLAMPGVVIGNIKFGLVPAFVGMHHIKSKPVDTAGGLIGPGYPSGGGPVTKGQPLVRSRTLW
jgi:hypothetical protein